VTIHRIVVGVDGSAHGNAALRWAVAESQVHHGEIFAVFAWQIPLIGIPGAFDRARWRALSGLHRGDRRPRGPRAADTDHDSAREGDVSASLIEAARDADMLVLGSRGRGGFAGLKLGSVSQECAQYATCPVVIVKQLGDV